MSSGSFRIITNKLFVIKYYIYKQDLALDILRPHATKKRPGYDNHPS